MNAATRPLNSPAVHHLQAVFLALLPRIELHARIAFRDVPCAQRREDAVAETVAVAWKWHVRLAERGKDVTHFVAGFAALAARAVRSGRRLVGQEKAKDVLSPLAQRRRGFRVEPLPASTCTAFDRLHADPHGQQKLDAFEERLRDNTLTPVADQAAFRIDFPAWLKTLTPRERRVVRAMARNERTKDLSRRFGVSPARISQLRRAFHDNWLRYHGEGTPSRPS